jgi:hypothetical protein
MQAKAKQSRQTKEEPVVEDEFLVGSDAVMDKLGNPDITDLTFVEVEGGLYIDSGESTIYAEVEGGETVAEEVEDIPDDGTEITVTSPEEKVDTSSDTDATLAGD